MRVFSGAKRCISASSCPVKFTPSPRTARRTFGPMPCPSRQPILCSSFTPIVEPLGRNRSVRVPCLLSSSVVVPSPANPPAVCNSFDSSASARSSSSMKSSGRCVGAFWSFARWLREDTKVEGVQPSFDPTVMKYLESADFLLPNGHKRAVIADIVIERR